MTLVTKLCYAVNPGVGTMLNPLGVLHSFGHQKLNKICQKGDSQTRSYSKFGAQFSLHKLDYVSRNIALGLTLHKIFHKLLNVSYCFGLYFHSFWLAQPSSLFHEEGQMLRVLALLAKISQFQLFYTLDTSAFLQKLVVMLTGIRGYILKNED